MPYFKFSRGSHLNNLSTFGTTIYYIVLALMRQVQHFLLIFCVLIRGGIAPLPQWGKLSSNPHLRQFCYYFGLFLPFFPYVAGFCLLNFLICRLWFHPGHLYHLRWRRGSVIYEQIIEMSS